MFTEYAAYDATGLAELVRRGEVTPSELIEAAIAKCEAENPRLNAVVTPLFDLAREVAKGEMPDGPFRGVPFLIKDLESIMKGAPQTKGSRAYKDWTPDFDNALVQRFKAAGLNIFGKTNCPEFGLMGVTEPELFGPTRNPHHPDHTPGGSSGGSAAAVAAKIVPVASAGDGGGSIRIPSSCCGLFGLKPSRGRTPLGPDQGEIWLGAVTSHVVTRTVRDSAAFLDFLQGADVGAPYEIRLPERPYAEEVTREPGVLKIGFSTASPLGMDVDSECVTAVEKTAKLLESLGHEVVEAAPQFDGEAMLRAYAMIYFGEVDAMIQEIGRIRGRRVRRHEVEAATWALHLLGRATPAGDFVATRYRWNDVTRAFGRYFEDYDIWLTPTLAAPPVRIGELQPSKLEQFGVNLVNRLGAGWLLRMTGTVEDVMVKNLAKMPFTQAANIAGIPAMSAPLHRAASGLPVGLQFHAGFGREDVLFRLAGQLEQTELWRV